jgi:hypothetical protein
MPKQNSFLEEKMEKWNEKFPTKPDQPNTVWKDEAWDFLISTLQEFADKMAMEVETLGCEKYNTTEFWNQDKLEMALEVASLIRKEALKANLLANNVKE